MSDSTKGERYRLDASELKTKKEKLNHIRWCTQRIFEEFDEYCMYKNLYFENRRVMVEYMKSYGSYYIREFFVSYDDILPDVEFNDVEFVLDQDTVNRITTILDKMEYTRNTAHLYMDSIKDRQRDIARLRKELGV